MPVFGKAPHLEDALGSILGQSLKSWKLCIVLDRPSPATLDLAISFSASEPRISFIESLRPGISAALNLGISVSHSKFIARLDSDDMMAPNRLATQLREMEKDPRLVVLGSQSLYVDDMGKEIGRSHLPQSKVSIRYLLPIHNVVSHPTVMMSRAAVIEVGGYNPLYDGVEDYLLWLQLSRIGDIRNCGSCLTAYRVHSSQFTATRGQIIRLLACMARLNYFLSPVKPTGERWIDTNREKALADKKAVIVGAENLMSRQLRRQLIFARLVGEARKQSMPKALSRFVAAALLNPAGFLKLGLMHFGSRLVYGAWRIPTETRRRKIRTLPEVWYWS